MRGQAGFPKGERHRAHHRHAGRRPPARSTLLEIRDQPIPQREPLARDGFGFGAPASRVRARRRHAAGDAMRTPPTCSQRTKELGRQFRLSSRRRRRRSEACDKDCRSFPTTSAPRIDAARSFPVTLRTRHRSQADSAGCRPIRRGSRQSADRSRGNLEAGRRRFVARSGCRAMRIDVEQPHAGIVAGTPAASSGTSLAAGLDDVDAVLEQQLLCASRHHAKASGLVKSTMPLSGNGVAGFGRRSDPGAGFDSNTQGPPDVT